MKVMCEVSVRHVHLNKADLKKLFGLDELEFDRALSQPGEYLSKQRVTVAGPKRQIENVAVIGPARAYSQVEFARTDCFTVGLKDVPVRQSGELSGSVGVKLINGDKELSLVRGTIIAKRHVHLDTATAKANGFTDGEIVNIVFDGPRGGTLGEAVVRVSDKYVPAVHIDTDEGNAMFAGGTVTVIKQNK